MRYAKFAFVREVFGGIIDTSREVRDVREVFWGITDTSREVRDVREVFFDIIDNPLYTIFK